MFCLTWMSERYLYQLSVDDISVTVEEVYVHNNFFVKY
jgi:hypothetical protein